MSPSHRDNDHYIHSSGGFSLSANWFLRLVYPSRQSKMYLHVRRSFSLKLNKQARKGFRPISASQIFLGSL